MKREFSKIHRENLSKAHIGINALNKHPKWNGGLQIRSNGYMAIRIDKHKYQLLHRYIMEQHLGRKLDKSEAVHHIDGNKKNNDLSNLELRDRGEHAREHALLLWEKRRCSIS